MEEVVMQQTIEAPPISFRIGDASVFALEITLRAREPTNAANGSSLSPSTPNDILELADGLVALWVHKTNVFELRPTPNLPDYLRLATNISLTYLLEWIWFDKAYDLPEGQSRSFSDLIDGDDSPPIEFTRRGDRVEVDWDLQEYTRCRGVPYANPVGRETIPYATYLGCLDMLAKQLAASLQARSLCLGCEDLWQSWVVGYEQERQAFAEFLKAAATVGYGKVAAAV